MTNPSADLTITMKKEEERATRIWEVNVSEIPGTSGHARVSMLYGMSGCAMTERISYFKKGKNIGRANETTPLEQARLEALSKARKKLSANYVLTDPSQVAGEPGFENNGRKVLLPMLAKGYTPRQISKAGTLHLQPKLDGFRCVAGMVDGQVRLTTRNGKPIDTLQEISDELSLVFALHSDLVLDGEIYYHGWSFQRISSAIKKRSRDTSLLNYCIFDSISDAPFKDRYRVAKEALGSIRTDTSGCIAVETISARTEKDVNTAHNAFVSQGYEGTIIRVGKCRYRCDRRSGDLLKKKDFEDAEYVIVGGEKELLQNDEYGVIYTVKDPANENIQFNVRPAGSMETRSGALKSLADDIGKKLTVRFQELTNGGIPRFPVGLHLRELD